MEVVLSEAEAFMQETGIDLDVTVRDVGGGLHRVHAVAYGMLEGRGGKGITVHVQSIEMAEYRIVDAPETWRDMPVVLRGSEGFRLLPRRGG